MNGKPKPPIGLDELNPSNVSPAGAGVNEKLRAQKAEPIFDEKGISEIARAPFWLISMFTGLDAWQLTDSEAARLGTVLAPLGDKYLNEWAKTHQAEIIAVIAIAGVTANKARAVRVQKDETKIKSAEEKIIDGGGAPIQAERDKEIMAALKDKK